jgi:hypothetical protein
MDNLRVFSKQLEEGEITWYMELWDNGKLVTAGMLSRGHEGGGPKKANSEPSGSSTWLNMYEYVADLP